MPRRARLLVPVVLWVSLCALSVRAEPVAANATGEVMPNPAEAGSTGLGDLGVMELVGLVTAVGALGTAAFSLVDATKAFRGGVSNIGFRDIEGAMQPFAAALDLALGHARWREVIHAHWINGRPSDEQKAIAKSLIRLGLAGENAEAIAKPGHVDPVALQLAATKLRDGSPLDEKDLNVLGRLDASVEAQLDAAFDRADQRYRNSSRALAGVAAVALSWVATLALGWRGWHDFTLALVIGLLAVPLAPIAKDLASSLQAAAQAMRAAK
jgi:hypothetical protein